MGIQSQASVKFELIYDAIQHDDNMLSISKMCAIAGVSRSGYYAWLDSMPLRQQREEQDQKDFQLIIEAYRFRGYAKGARGIYMRLLHINVRMNLKKIRRLMKKYGLKCQIRSANPYRRMAKALKTSNVAPNIVNREFTSLGPRKILLTDITYLFYDGGKCYLSTILDAVTHEILAYMLSQSLEVEFVLKTVDRMVEKHGYEVDSDTIVHSDQGFHYTSMAFIQKLKDDNFVQSMSRKGNCWDNAPQESFYGHMKDEIADMISELKNYHDVASLIDDWIDYYNKDRYQWELLKLSPAEYYQYLITDIYPLPTCAGPAPHPGI